MHHRTPILLIKSLLVCALALAGAASGAAPDESKLRMLSCDKGAAQSQAMVDWLDPFTSAKQDDGYVIPGPLKLANACLKNVHLIGAFGVMMVQGEVCNAKLDEFTGALAAIGTKLGKQMPKKTPGFVMGMEEGDRSYVISDRMTDLATGEPVPMAGKYAFICTVRESGPQ